LSKFKGLQLFITCTFQQHKTFVVFAVIDEDRSCSISAVVSSPLYVPPTPRIQEIDRTVASARCGSRLNPWVVDAQIGQQIKISLFDFGHHQKQSQNILNGQVAAADLANPLDNCTVQYGQITDKAAATVRKNITGCVTSSGFQRHRLIYQSKGSTVEVVLSLVQEGQGGNQHNFLLGFEGIRRLFRDKISLAILRMCNGPLNLLPNLCR
jgi:hypothetical protein